MFEFIKSVRAEMKHVTWLSRREIMVTTILVIVVAGVIGYLLGFFDLIFTKLIEVII
ncbi:preprotein translocase subunit SecE [Candidatus Nomurabacteria bacterium]|nr:preprotein translocase subunit SecE [Candidatus Nomurabacteria bacterium]USN94611.1 MAG: preprotein translocase subunit SecE [Candidatus Nomurabacteria bacterium]